MTFFFRKNNYLLCTSTGLSKISSIKLDISGSTVWEKNQQPWPLQTSLRHMDGAAAVPAFSLVLKHARHCRTFAQAVLMLWMHVLCALSPHGLSQLLIGIWSRIIFITDITWYQSGSHWSSATMLVIHFVLGQFHACKPSLIRDRSSPCHQMPKITPPVFGMPNVTNPSILLHPLSPSSPPRSSVPFLFPRKILLVKRQTWKRQEWKALLHWDWACLFYD